MIRATFGRFLLGEQNDIERLFLRTEAAELLTTQRGLEHGALGEQLDDPELAELAVDERGHQRLGRERADHDVLARMALHREHAQRRVHLGDLEFVQRGQLVAGTLEAVQRGHQAVRAAAQLRAERVGRAHEHQPFAVVQGHAVRVAHWLVEATARAQVVQVVAESETRLDVVVVQRVQLVWLPGG